jgi:hypothetical protein
MQPLNQSFRRLLYRNLGKLNRKDVAKFERLTALRHQLTEERRFQGTKPNPDLLQAIGDLDKKINKIFSEEKCALSKLHKSYIETRKVALQQNHFFQIPIKNFGKYIFFMIQHKVARIRRVFWLLGS